MLLDKYLVSIRASRTLAFLRSRRSVTGLTINQSGHIREDLKKATERLGQHPTYGRWTFRMFISTFLFVRSNIYAFVPTSHSLEPVFPLYAFCENLRSALAHHCWTNTDCQYLPDTHVCLSVGLSSNYSYSPLFNLLSYTFSKQK